MSTSYYIRSLETIVFTDHIIKGEFTPAHDYEDEFDPGRKHHYPDTLRLWLDQLKVGIEYAYEDKPMGSASQSAVLTVTGEDAVALWVHLKLQAIPFPSVPREVDPESVR